MSPTLIGGCSPEGVLPADQANCSSEAALLREACEASDEFDAVRPWLGLANRERNDEGGLNEAICPPFSLKLPSRIGQSINLVLSWTGNLLLLSAWPSVLVSRSI